jgi:TetR/AcrR family transcriptional regulator, transcriptional repressor for nem operon
MRYDAEQKHTTREKMVTTAARVLRRDGIAAAGVASLMAEAGLTNGAFYAHFESKEALVAAAVVAALDESRAAMALKIQAAAPGHALDAVIDHYLDPRHVTHPEKGCAVAALGAELARRPEASREAIAAAIDELVATIATALPKGHRNRMDVARTVFASMVGTIQLARTCRPALVATVLKAGAGAARQIGQPPQPGSAT